MNRIILIATTVFLLTIITKQISAQAPSWAWVKEAAGTAYDFANAIATDANGNVYVTGRCDGDSIHFGSIILTGPGLGYTFMFVVKYDPLGNLLWAKTISTTGNSMGLSIATDYNNNCYVTGQFDQDLIFAPDTLTSNGSYDGFIIKYDASGNVLWAKSFGGSNSDYSCSISADVSGHCYVTGSFESDSIAFGNDTLINFYQGSIAYFVAKFDASGNPLWARTANGHLTPEGPAITADVLGNCYVTGGFMQDSVVFSPFTVHNTQAPPADIFTVKYDTAGNVQWAKGFGGTFYDKGSSIAVDLNGNCYITGYFANGAGFDSYYINSHGGYDMFVAKCDAAGNVLWAKSAGSTDDDRGNNIVADAGGNSYVTGTFKNANMTFSTTITLVNSGWIDLFVSKYSPAGNVLWAKGATNGDADEANGVAVDGSGNCYVAGEFHGNGVTFDSITVAGSGDYDVFIAKLGGTTGLQENSLSETATLYPNPFSTQTVLQIGNVLQHATLQVVNVFGQTVRELKNISGPSVTITRDNLPTGLYFIRLVKDDGMIASKKIVIVD